MLIMFGQYFKKDFTVDNMKKLDDMDTCMIFQLIMMVSMLMIYLIFINI